MASTMEVAGWKSASLEGYEAPEAAVFVQRCGECEWYASDIEAAEARGTQGRGEYAGIVCGTPRGRHFRGLGVSEAVTAAGKASPIDYACRRVASATRSTTATRGN